MNTLQATLTAITTSEHLSILTVVVGEDNFHLLLAEVCHDKIGTQLTLIFKETEIILSTDKTDCTANRAYGTILSIRTGEVLSEVVIRYFDTQICALVPTLTLSPLGMEVGMRVGWAIQPSEISLLRGHHGS